MDGAQRFLRAEINRLNAKDLIVSSNIPVRNDGGMYASHMHKQIDDPGVAIYFKYKDKNISMVCDQYLTVWENIYALGCGIEALRSMERWGVSDFLERAFTGFTALNEATVTPYKRPWYEVLGVQKNATEDQIKTAYREKAKIHHPDVTGGNADEFHAVQTAYEEGLEKNTFV